MHSLDVIRPLKLLEKDENLQKAFEKLSTGTELGDDIVAEISTFICFVYGKKMLSDTNKARLDIFLDKYKPKSDEDRVGTAKKLDGSSLPPCHDVLLEKIRRTCFVANLWKSSVSAHPPLLDPTDFGWKISADSLYEIIW